MNAKSKENNIFDMTYTTLMQNYNQIYHTLTAKLFIYHIGCNGHLGRHLIKMLFECPILVDFKYLLHTCNSNIHVRHKIQTVITSNYYVMQIYVGRGMVVTLNID